MLRHEAAHFLCAAPSELSVGAAITLGCQHCLPRPVLPTALCTAALNFVHTQSVGQVTRRLPACPLSGWSADACWDWQGRVPDGRASRQLLAGPGPRAHRLHRDQAAAVSARSLTDCNTLRGPTSAVQMLLMWTCTAASLHCNVTCLCQVLAHAHARRCTHHASGRSRLLLDIMECALCAWRSREC